MRFQTTHFIDSVNPLSHGPCRHLDHDGPMFNPEFLLPHDAVRFAEALNRPVLLARALSIARGILWQLVRDHPVEYLSFNPASLSVCSCCKSEVSNMHRDLVCSGRGCQYSQWYQAVAVSNAANCLSQTHLVLATSWRHSLTLKTIRNTQLHQAGPFRRSAGQE
jgi:hypothetical protein